MEELTCPKCLNKKFEFSAEFNFESNYINPICTKCEFSISKVEYTRQVEEFTQKALIKAMKKAGFTQK